MFTRVRAGGEMAGKTLTRMDLSEAIFREVGLSRNEASALVEAVLGHVSDALAAGEQVKISGFGTFSVRSKAARVGRNPKTGDEVPISPRRVLSFRASNLMKDRVVSGNAVSATVAEMGKSPDAFRTIGEVASWLDVAPHVLRFWESKFAQVRPVKRAGGRRYYRREDIELLGGIKVLLHERGLTIKGVQKVLGEEGRAAVASHAPPLDADLPEGGGGRRAALRPPRRAGVSPTARAGGRRRSGRAGGRRRGARARR